MLGLIYVALMVRLSLVPDVDAHLFNFETASKALMPARPTRLVYAWDGPMHPDPGALEQLGGYFFRREGQAITVEPVTFNPGQDPNAVLLVHASAPGDAIIWIYDKGVRGTAAIAHPPAIALLRERGWRCRNFGDKTQGVIACQRAS
jgi:hypothetical protein